MRTSERAFGSKNGNFRNLSSGFVFRTLVCERRGERPPSVWLCFHRAGGLGGAVCLAGRRTLQDGKKQKPEKQMAGIRALRQYLVYGKAGGDVQHFRQKDEEGGALYHARPNSGGGGLRGDGCGGNYALHDVCGRHDSERIGQSAVAGSDGLRHVRSQLLLFQRFHRFHRSARLHHHALYPPDGALQEILRAGIPAHLLAGAVSSRFEIRRGVRASE